MAPPTGAMPPSNKSKPGKASDPESNVNMLSGPRFGMSIRSSFRNEGSNCSREKRNLIFRAAREN
jgi:hypothetical protein